MGGKLLRFPLAGSWYRQPDSIMIAPPVDLLVGQAEEEGWRESSFQGTGRSLHGSEPFGIDDRILLVGVIPLEVQHSTKCRWCGAAIRRFRRRNLRCFPGGAQSLCGG